MSDVPLDRRRAKHALDRVQEVAAPGRSPAVQEAYRSYVQSVPTLIVASGLGQSLALLLAQGGKQTERGQGGKAPAAYVTIFEHLMAWLLDEDPARLFSGARPAGNAERLALVLGLGRSEYLVMQAEALVYLDWLKKFANALLGGAERGG
jgi:CRISPR-associated protein Cmr5